jgi:hypothetical protein
MALRCSDGSPFTNTRPAAVSTTAASWEFCPAVMVRPVVIEPVRALIACFRVPGRSSQGMRCSTVLPDIHAGEDPAGTRVPDAGGLRQQAA